MLNKNQEKAASIHDGQLILIACPGSGKTTVIVERTHRMIQAGIHPANILVVTFTNQAANQMKARYEAQYGNDPVLFGTIHSLCYRVLSKRYGYSRNDILKPSEQWEFFRTEIYQRKIKCDDMENFIKSLLGEISAVRNRELPIEKYKSATCDQEEFIRLYEAYTEYKQHLGKIDFDDMLISCKKVFETMPEELAYWKKQFPYIMVDEYQDVNKIQADIFYLLAGDNGNICIVGDDDQSIYKFRAADFKIMLDFPKRYPNCIEIPLTTNYRSEPVIIKHAAALIEHNKSRFKKDFLAARAQKNGMIKVVPTDSPSKEADQLIQMIEAYHSAGVAYNEMAVLYRTNAQNQILLGKLLKATIPFYTTEQPKDYHNDFIFGDIMAYYRLASGTWQKGDAQRVLNRPGRYLKAAPFKDLPFDRELFLKACNAFSDSQKIQAVAKVREFFGEIENLSQIHKPITFCKHIGIVMRYREWTKGFAEFCRRDPEATLDLFDMLQEESKDFETMKEWQDYADFYASELQKKRRDSKKDGICLSTFHSAKGLEWKVVFIIDANEGVCPAKQAETEEDFEEERRAFYVAVTRAKDHLILIYTISNEDTKKAYSRYIPEMGLSV